MEKWKIATIAALLISLVGFGIVQQNADKQRNNPNPVPSGTPLPLPYLGKTLPPWSFKTWNSKPVSLASLQGKPAFIEIFRTGCSHCQDAAPLMAAIHARYAPRGLKMVGIQSPGAFKDATNPENSWPDVLTWLKGMKITYPVAFDDGSKYFQGTVKKQILGNAPEKLLYPTMLLTDKSGKVDFAQTGHNLSQAIALAVELEKRFPTSDSTEKNAVDLVKWLNANLPELKINGSLSKAFADDIAQRLKKSGQ